MSEKQRLQMAVKAAMLLSDEREGKNVRRFAADVVEEVLDRRLRSD